MSHDQIPTFRDRVDFAAKVISSGRNTTRRFDGCFECCDGDAVAVALYRRAKKRPGTKLSKNLWRYLARVSVVPAAWANRTRVDLDAWSDDLISRFTH